jgi:hypothetical protein
MANMHEPLPHECPGQKIGLLRTDWPTRFQRRVLREAMDMSRHGDFHETSLATGCALLSTKSADTCSCSPISD